MDDENETEAKTSDAKQDGFSVSVQITDILGLGSLSGNLKPASQSILAGIGTVFAPLTSYLHETALGAADRHNAYADAKLLAKLGRDVQIDEATLNQIKARFLKTEIRRNQNILDTTRLAIEQSEDNGSHNSYEIDQDFVFDWVDGVQDVSASQVQALWAAILSKAPQNESGRVSKPAMNLLREFDHRIANSFLTYLRLVECCGLPSIGIPPEKWKEFGFEIDFELLEDVGILSMRDGIDRIGIEPFIVEQISAGRSNLRLKLLPTMGCWAPTRRARELADCVPNSEFTAGEDLTVQVLDANLNSFSDDPHWNLRMTADAIGISLTICQSSNGFGPSTPGASGAELDRQIASFSGDMPNKFVTVFRKLASEARLRIGEEY